MKKFLQTLMLAAAMLLPFVSQAQNSLTIAEGGTATSNVVPAYVFYFDDYTRSQFVIPATELSAMNGGSVTSMTFYTTASNMPYTTVSTVDVYLMEVSYTSISAFEPKDSNAIVYSGTLNFVATSDGGSVTITFTTPFAYTGGNLLVGIENTTDAGYKNISFYGETVSGASVGASNGTSLDNVSATQRNFLPTTTFTYTGGSAVCNKPASLVVSGITAHEATLTWTSTPAALYQVETKAAADTVWGEWTPQTDTTFSMSLLQSNTAYDVRVKSICGADSESGYKTASFTTLISCPTPTGLSATLTPGDGTVATLTWHEAGTATAWQICFNGDTTNYIDVYDSTYSFTGLTPETAYTAKVRAICDVDDLSTWSSTITFTPTNDYLITVNDGTTTNGYVPIYGFYCDDITKSQFIIPAADLTTLVGGTITKLTFYASQSSVSWGAAEFNVYLTTTSETGVATLADYTTMTQVYAGTLSISDNKMEVNMTTPFVYAGGNLMVGFLQTVEGSYVSSSWYGVSAEGASMGGYGSSISQRNFLPKTTFNFVPAGTDVCMPVANLTVSNITIDGATLSWTGTASSYTIYDLSDSTTVATVSDTSYTFTNLDALTLYNYGVVANCSGDQSIMMTVSFSTPCVAATLPFTETFEATSSTLACWTTDGPGNWTVGTGDYSTSTGAFEGSTNAKINHSSTGNATKLISPVLDGVVNGMTLDFAHIQRAWSGDQDELRVYYRADADSAWIQVAEYSNEVSTWTVENIVIPGTVYQVAFEMTDGYGYGVAIDSVVFTEMGDSYCYTVTDLAVDSVTSSSISLSWNDNNNTGATYSIYGADGSVIASGISTTNYEVTGLLASTSYTFGVVANCSATDASNVVTVSASTTIECAGGSCFVELNGADSYGDGWNGNAINVMQNGNLIETFTLTEGDINNAHITVCSGAPVVFTWVAGSYPGEASFEIKNGAGMVVYTGVGSTSMATGDTIFVLNNACPTCLPVTNMTVTDATETSVTISWAGTAASYNVYNGTSFVANVNTNSYTFTGLTTSTNYTFGVMAICSDTDSADMSTINASTTCAVINTFPYTQDFASMPACWNTIDADADGFTWVNIEGAMHSASYDNSYGALTPDNWLITPQFQLAAGTNYEVTWNANPQDTSWPAEHYGIFVSTTTADTAAFTLLQDWTLTSAGHVPVVDLSTYAGQTIYLAFRHWNCTDMFRVAIDNFQIRAAAGANQITVTLTQNNPMYGSVAGGGVYTIGDSVTITATPATGYHFSEWLSATGAVITDNPYTFIAATDITLQAVFELGGAPSIDTLTVTVAVNNAAMGTTNPVPGTYQYITGDTVVLSATPTAGHRFVGWAWDIDGDVDTLGVEYIALSFPADIFMDYGSMTFTALFEAGNPDSTTVTYAVNNPVMGTTTPAPGTYTIYVGSTIEASATANAGYYLDAWVLEIVLDGDVYSSDTLYSDDPEFENPMNFGTLPQSFADYGASLVITAIFAADTTGPVDPDYINMTFAVNDATMGTITPNGTQRLQVGTEFTVIATPAADCYLESWTLTLPDGISVTLDEDVPLYFTDTVTVDLNGSTLTANFARNQGIDDVETGDFSVYTQNDKIVVKGVENLSVNVYDVTGRCVKNVTKATETVEVTVPAAGVYMVKAGNFAAKRVVVLR